MPNLSDFLKCEKVRCVNKEEHRHLTKDKIYQVIGVGEYEVEIIDDEGDKWGYEYEYFEPVLEIQATNALDDTPMGTRTVNEFEVGDWVYFGNDDEIHVVSEIDEDGDLRIGDWAGFVGSNRFCHATPENYAMLCKLYPHIEFEAPPTELTGSDLCMAMLEEWRIVPCLVSDVSDEQAIQEKHTLEFIDLHSSGTFKGQRHEWTYAVPFDPKTGKILTSEVLEK